MHDPSASPHRYAVYFSPSETTPLAGLGNEWLGRDAATGALSIPKLPDGIDEREWSRVTEAAARYGFHATLKPPFKLAPGAALQDLLQALANFAGRKSRIVAPRVAIRTIGHFLALVLVEESEAFSNFAADCVRDFDSFRAPASEHETNKRMHGSLTQRERENLVRWGYPYVLDTWKFHMTLTCSLAAGPREIFRQHLSRRFAEACIEPLCIDSICLYEEPGAGMPFRLLKRFRLGL